MSPPGQTRTPRTGQPEALKQDEISTEHGSPDGLVAQELTVERARAYLAECVDLDEVRDLRDKAAAVAHYQRQHAAGSAAAIDAAIIALRAERRLGELVAELPKQAGSRGVGKKVGCQAGTPLPTLADLGITKKQSYRWQSIAAVPEDAFEDAMGECMDRGKPPTVTAIMKLGRKPKPKEPEGFHILFATGELQNDLDRVIAKARAKWPESSHPHITRIIREKVNELEPHGSVHIWLDAQTLARVDAAAEDHRRAIGPISRGAMVEQIVHGHFSAEQPVDEDDSERDSDDDEQPIELWKKGKTPEAEIARLRALAKHFARNAEHSEGEMREAYLAESERMTAIADDHEAELDAEPDDDDRLVSEYLADQRGRA